jgi:ABC-type multidrug transport system fused ATPase/permease subunit
MKRVDRQDRAWLIRQMQPSRWLYLTGFVCIAVSYSTALLNPLMLKWPVDNILPHQQWRLLATCTACFFVLYVLQLATFWAANLVTTRAVQRMVFRIRTELLQHLQTLAADYHERRSVGDIFFRLEQDVEQVGEIRIDVFPSAIRMGLMVILARPETRLQQTSTVVQDLAGKRSAFLHEVVPATTQVQLLGRERRQDRGHVCAPANSLS